MTQPSADIVPLVDLRAQSAALAPELLAAAERVIRSGLYVGGSEVLAFEAELAAVLGAVHSVACASGTAALHLALAAFGVGPGDEVITVSHTFAATALAIVMTGAVPIFVDVDEETATMSPQAVEAALSPRTRAVIPVHLYGRPAAVDRIAEIAHAAGVKVIEDAAQAHGATLRGQPVGTLGDAACWSFYPTKNLGAIGEGGAVTTADEAAAERMRILRNVGQRAKYDHVMTGFNYRMPELTAALLRVKLPHLAAWNERRRSIARLYDGAFGAASSPVAADTLPEHMQPVHHVYPVYHPRRDSARDELEDLGIQTGIHYPVPVHLQAPFRSASAPGPDLPVTERLAASELSLPMYPELTDAQVDRVIEAVLSLAP